MISIETLDNRYFPTRHQRRLQPVRIAIGCGSQRFQLKPQRFIKLSISVATSAQCLNGSRPVGHWRIVSHILDQSVGFLSLPPVIHSESEIVSTYLACSFYRQIHQYVAHLIKRFDITHDIGLLCVANQFIRELDEYPL